MTVVWNHCQALVFSLFFHSLGAELTKAQSVFFSIRSDDAQRRVTLASLGESDFASRAGATINELGKLSGRRNAFIHAIWDFSKGSAAATNWLDIWKKQLGTGDPLAQCEALIVKLEGILATLTELEEEGRTKRSPAQGAFDLQPLVMPVRQVAGQAATTAAPVRPQPDSQSLQQSSQSRDP